jgi:CobQ-like glutamine amidotransferase family enzyme
MPSDSVLRVAVLYPELLGTYGDGGNGLVLQQRARWREQAVELLHVAAGEAVPAECDLYVLGGGEDNAQSFALTGLTSTTAFSGAVDRGVPVFAVCAGLQLLGHTFEVGGDRTVAGMGVLDVVTTRLPRRAVGEVQVDVREDLNLPPLTGFENHGGGSRLGPAAQPLGHVVSGVGNGLDDEGTEGATQGSIVATYLHGPVLARNPALADLLLSRALGRQLDPLELPSVAALRAERLSAVTRSRGRLTRWPWRQPPLPSHR